MRDSSEIWCSTSDIDTRLINERALKYAEKGGHPAVAFLSKDLYAAMLKQYASINPHGHSILKGFTAYGEIDIRPINKYKNFLLVGANHDLDHLEMFGIDPIFLNDADRARITKAFEDLVLMEGKDET